MTFAKAGSLQFALNGKSQLTQQVRVAAPDEFVGRRRILQAGLRQLRKDRGLLLYGLGGVGKSTIAARLLERLRGYERLVIHRGLDEDKLISLLSQYCQTETGQGILSEKLPLRQRLSKFLKSGLNQPREQLIFVLDDFEANLQARGESWVLSTEAAPIFGDLLEAIAQSSLGHRLLITCRYQFELDRKLQRYFAGKQPDFLAKQVQALRGADLTKKCQRLLSFSTDSTVEADLREQAQAIADGNPRLLEWLDLLLQQSDLDMTSILAEMRDKEQEFLEDILAEQLLAQQSAAFRQLLALGLIFRVPVPQAALAAVWEGADLERCLERGRTLGLIEMFERPNALPTYRVPRLLSGLVVLPGDGEVLAKVGAEILYRLWLLQPEPDFLVSEEQMIEIHRLSLLGKSESIATNICLWLSSIYNQLGKFNQTLSVCEKTLNLTSNKKHRILLEQGDAYESLGLFTEAFNSYQSVKLVAKENEDKNIEGKVTGNLGVLYYNRGQLQEAFNNCTEALKIVLNFNPKDEQEILRLSDLLGVIWITQGNTEKSFNYYQQALKIAQKNKKFIRYEASCYSNLCDYYGIIGDSETAIDYGKRALGIQEKIKNLEGQASVLHGLAEVFIMEERYEEAISYVNQGIKIAQEVENPKLYSATYSAYAYANLLLNRLDEAWKAAITAEKYDYPPNSYYILMLLGLIALKQNQKKTSYNYIIKMLKNVKQTLSSMRVFSFKILDAQFIGICCLILITDTNNSEDYTAKATNTYKKARNLNQSQGTLKRIQQLFLILRSIDTDNRLTSLSVILSDSL